MPQQNTKIYRTSDIGIAAYLKFRGLTLVGYERGGFEFDDAGEQAKALSIEYANSEFSKFDHCVRSLKKLMYS